MAENAVVTPFTGSKSPMKEQCPNLAIADDVVNVSETGGTTPDKEISRELTSDNSNSPKNLAENNNGNSSRRRHRRKAKGGKHHRKWKPYSKLSWDEKQDQDERESKRAKHKREKRFASGQPMAPYNTTQFLMDEHEPSDPKFGTEKGINDKKNEPVPPHDESMNSSGEEFYYDSSNNEEEIFMEKQFTEAYEVCHAERLQQMSKEDLIKEYLELESKVERLEKRVRAKGDGDSHSSSDMETNSNHPSEDLSEKDDIEKEVKRLKAENEKLAKENHVLKRTSLNASEREHWSS